MKKFQEKIKNAITLCFDMVAILREESRDIDEYGDYGERSAGRFS